jgi:hypothetical protein
VLNWSDEKYKFTLGLGALALVGMLAELARPELPAWVAMAAALTPLILFVFLHPGELPDGVVRAAHVAASVWYLAAAAVVLNEGLRRAELPWAWALCTFLLLPGAVPCAVVLWRVARGKYVSPRKGPGRADGVDGEECADG